MGPNILLVDDDPLALHLMSGIVQLSMPKANIHQASEFSRASMLCELVSMDCMIVDYEMPDANGMVLARQLRQRFPYLPIIMCTGNGDELLAAQALKAGINDYLPKEKISTASILRAVNNAMSLGRQAHTIDDQRRELETIAFALANNFRSPIDQIRQSAARARSEAETENLPVLLDHVKEAAARLDRLVDLLLQFVTLNDFVEPEEIEVDLLAARTVQALGPFLASRKAKVTIAGQARAWADAKLVASALQELLFNGVNNNAHAAPEIRLEIVQGEQDVEIRVQDDGIGMSEMQRHRLFGRFDLERGPEAGDKSVVTGLGLALARKAIEAQEGTISCASSADRGTSFTIRLPAPEAVAPLITEQPSFAAAANG